MGHYTKECRSQKMNKQRFIQLNRDFAQSEEKEYQAFLKYKNFMKSTEIDHCLEIKVNLS